MKRIFICLFFGATCLATIPSFAQGDIDDFFVAEGETAFSDSRKLVEGYISPLMKGFGFGMANGWYTTAKPHKFFGFDVTATVNAAYVPDKDMLYDVSALNLERFSLAQGYEGDRVPTIFGPDFNPRYTYTIDDPITGQPVSTESFEGPPGLNLKEETGVASFVPVPMVQIGLGLIKNTDLKIRFIPEQENDDFSFKMFGVGLMHDVKQYIPGIKALPFDLSVFVGYTKLDFTLYLSDGSPGTEDQIGSFGASAFTMQGLISKKFSVLTVYGGLGFNRVRSELNMLGEYDVDGDGDTDITDPITDMAFPAGGPRATVGARLQLLVLTLHADYTLQEYNTLTVGVGLTVR